MDDLTVVGKLANIEAEQYVLGCMIEEPELIGESVLKRDHFFQESHKNIFSTLKSMDEKQIPVGLVEMIEHVGNHRVEKIGGVMYVGELINGIASTTNFKYHEGIVLKYFEKRQMHEIGQQLMQNALYEDPGQSRQTAVDMLTALDDNDASVNDGNIRQGLSDLYDWAEIEHGDITGAATGYTELDKMTSGFQKQDFIIVGARPSVGKTAFALNVCLNYAAIGGPVGIFSLEMPSQSLLKRMVSNIRNIDAQKMRNPAKEFVADDWAKFTIAMGELNNMPFHIFDKAGVDMSYIRKHCRMMKRMYPSEHVVIMIDYLQLIIGDPKFGGNRVAEIGEISRQLKTLARELDITIVALSQLSRGVESRQDKRPMMSDLRESGQIEQDADVIAFLYREDYYDRETEAKNIIEIIVGKQRNGPTGSVELAFIKEFNKFVNLQRRFD